MSLNKELLEILACPRCKGSLTPVDDEQGLFCPACDVVYPVRDEIPVMLVDEVVPKADWDRGVRERKK
jgi:hypothetical protein